jgi:hypothetical protein
MVPRVWRKMSTSGCSSCGFSTSTTITIAVKNHGKYPNLGELLPWWYQWYPHVALTSPQVATATWTRLPLPSSASPHRARPVRSRSQVALYCSPSPHLNLKMETLSYTWHMKWNMNHIEHLWHPTIYNIVCTSPKKIWLTRTYGVWPLQQVHVNQQNIWCNQQ